MSDESKKPTTGDALLLLVEQLTEQNRQQAESNRLLSMQLTQLQASNQARDDDDRREREDAEAKARGILDLDPARRRIAAIIEAEMIRGPNIPEQLIPMTSEVAGIRTGEGENEKLHSATFVMVVQRGKVIRLDHYKLPDGVYLPQAEGGICPFDRHKMFLPNSNQPTQELKHWIYHTFYLQDARWYVGRRIRLNGNPQPLPPNSGEPVAVAPVEAAAE